ncbi:metalloregulator ArsR/SmtB family transcription factor [Chromohalobacter israelensis]|uniref:metalloregulator ArsR/SmtB family transcription factor n=1 Tax=Chromohalobacter israelensis TaxID=141390 RepID=UPI001F0C05D0|nr:metalloregulator ArsR/SmtB family transcription factor [Chromohalobacter salexigens]
MTTAVLTPAALHRCLADETRLTLTLLLCNEPELCVCEMTEALAAPQPRVSRHLAYLRRAGLLRGRRRGAWIYYRLEPTLPEWVSTILEASRDAAPPEVITAHRRLADAGTASRRQAACHAEPRPALFSSTSGDIA